MRRWGLATLLVLGCAGDVPVTPGDAEPPALAPPNCSCAATLANTHTLCINGTCMWNCDAGFLDCDLLAENGCEVDSLSDAKNCGTCGHDCLETTCANGACVPRLLASGQSDPYAIALDGDFVYWLARGAGTLLRAPNAGG